MLPFHKLVIASIYQGQTVTVTYDRPDLPATTRPPSQDTAGNDAASFTTGEDGVPAVSEHFHAGGVGRARTSRPISGPRPATLQVALTWDAPASGSGVTRHEYQYKTSGEYLDDWKQIADSAPGEANEASFTVTGLTGGTAHTFQLRAVSADGNSTAAEDGPVTPMAPAGPDATLSALVVTYGSSEVPLSPFFAPGTTSYTASVANAVAEVTVTPTTNHADATIAWLDASDMTLADADTGEGRIPGDAGGGRQRRQGEGDGGGP